MIEEFIQQQPVISLGDWQWVHAVARATAGNGLVPIIAIGMASKVCQSVQSDVPLLVDFPDLAQFMATRSAGETDFAVFE